jgi:hypothetical protein
MKQCPQCGGPISTLRRLIYGSCRNCGKLLEEQEQERWDVEANREWNLNQVDLEKERQWQPENCPYCTESMHPGYVWTEEGTLVWAAGQPTYKQSDFAILKEGDDEDSMRRAHLCESCGSVLIVQMLRKPPVISGRVRPLLG